MRWLGMGGAAMLLLGGAWAVGFAAFDYRAGLAAELPAAADGMVALTGGVDRVDSALGLLAAGRAPLLLISGVGRGAELAELEHRVRLSADQVARVTLGREATSTLGNAEETATWARAHGLRSLIVVTAGYHMPRALVELGRALPDVRLYPAPVQPQALRRGREMAVMRMLANEYDKFLAVSLGLTRRSEVVRVDTGQREAGGS